MHTLVDASSYSGVRIMKKFGDHWYVRYLSKSNVIAWYSFFMMTGRLHYAVNCARNLWGHFFVFLLGHSITVLVVCRGGLCVGKHSIFRWEKDSLKKRSWKPRVYQFGIAGVSDVP